MPRIKLTKSTVDRLPAPDPSGKQVLYWEEGGNGFGVLVSGKTTKKSYIVQRDVNGRTRRQTIGPVDDDVMTLKEARQKAGKVINKMYDGVDPKMAKKEQAARNYTLKDAMKDHTETALSRKQMKQISADQFKEYFDRYLSDWLDRPLSEITPDDVLRRHDKIQKDVQANARFKNNKGYAAANTAIRLLCAVWNSAKLRYPALPDNPAKLPASKKFPSKPRTVHLVYEEDASGNVERNDFKAFYDAVTHPEVIPNKVQRMFIEFILFSGFRRRAASGLQWSEVDFDKRLITLGEDRTKAGRAFTVPMSDHLHSLLVELRQLVPAGKWCFPANSKSGHVEEPKYPMGLIEKVCGVKVSVHDLRASYITVALECIPLGDVKGLCDHSITGLENDVTLVHYNRKTPERLRGSAQAVCDRLKILCEVGQVTGANVVKMEAK